ncbi:MAG: DNA methyltransferase [Acidimicrobiales bacterium]
MPGPAEGADPTDWNLRSSGELLELKVCDPAVGSGAILVAACRYLADRLVEAWTAERAPEVEGDPDEVVITARRAVADRCLYGVDRDPMAVEMAKLSLWLVTLSKERPFTFLDHALKAGDSLLGVTDLDQLRALHLDPVVGRAKVALSVKPEAVDEAVSTAIDLRRRLESIAVVTVRDAEEKARLNWEADRGLDALQTVADLVVGCALRAELANQPAPEDQVAGSAPLVAAALDLDQPSELREAALAEIGGRARKALDAGRPDAAPHRHPLHWPIAFPEVFVDRGRSGFDAMVGNPPFLGGKRISGAAGSDLRELLVRWIAAGKKGNADLVTYFLLRAAQVSTGFGFLATNTLSQGDTREVGLDQLAANGWTIHQAVKSKPWPGTATLEIAKVWITLGHWKGRVVLDGNDVPAITPSLDPAGRVTGNPYRLAANARRSFQGSNVLGLGFITTPEEAAQLIDEDPSCADVLFRYLNGEDLNSSPRHAARRWVIDFRERSMAEATRYAGPWQRVERLVRPERAAKDASKYPRMVHEWWKHWNSRVVLYEAINDFERVIAITLVSKVVQPVLVPTGQVFAHKLAVFAYDDDFHFGLLSSAFHWWWAVARSSTMRTDLNYSPTDCFETFPQASFDGTVEAAGGTLNESRSELMVRNDEGLTKTYNRVHDPDDDSPDIQELRDLHVKLDLAVRDVYGWADINLDYGFHDTPQGRRYTFGPVARTEVLDRLLELNHQRYAEEVAAGLHDTTKKGGRKTESADAPTLL